MKRQTGGFTLIEVLVAVLVLSAGLLGVAGTMLTATRSSTSNYLKQQGVQYAYDIVDRMRANLLVASATSSSNPYVVDFGTPAATPAKECTSSGGSVADCNPAQMAAYDVWQWQNSMKSALPGGSGAIVVEAGGPQNSTAIVTVTVQWSDQPAQALFNKSSAATDHTYTVVTAL